MRKKTYYWIFMLLTIWFSGGAVMTLIPADDVSKVNMLGYMSKCSFAPVSTLICLLLAGVSCKIRSRFK